MKNFITAPGSSTCYMEQRSSDDIIADVNDDNIDKGQCHHFSIREYVRQMQMSNSTFCSLSDGHISSSLVTTKTYRRWNCKSCWDKLEPLYNTTAAATLSEFERVPEDAVGKELSQEKGSAKCHPPSSYNKESTEVDRAINDLYELAPINQENGSAKYLSPSWGNKESADADPVVNGAGLHEASPSNPDGTKKMPDNVDFRDDTNQPDTCQKINEKKEINDTNAEPPMLGRSKKGSNSVKSLPVKRKDETHASLHNIEKNVSKTYKRRKNTKAHDFINDSSVVDCQNRSENNRAGNSKEKHVISIMQPDGGLLHPGVCLSEGNIPYTTNIMDGDASIRNNGVYQTPCGSENELECSKMYLSKVSPGKSEQTHRKKTEDKEDECVIVFVEEVSTKVQSEKSNPEFSQFEQQQSPHLHNEQPLSVTEYEEDDCVIIGVLSLTTYSESCGTQSGYPVGMSEEETPCPIYRGKNLAPSSSHQFPANCSPQHLGYVTPVSIPEPERGSSHSTKGKSKIVDSSDKSSEEDICALSLSLYRRP